MKQVEVAILGQVYMLACPEGGEALLAAAVQRVDREMTAIRDAGRVRARERIAVLAALNLAWQIAERPAATVAAAAVAAAPATPAAPAIDETALDALLRRIDAVLGDDGQLL